MANPIESSVSSKVPRAFKPFMTSLFTTAETLDHAGIPRTDWMVFAGGAVALHQMSRGIYDRVPTDLDVALYHKDEKDGGQRLHRVANAFNSIYPNSTSLSHELVIGDSYTHYNPLLSVSIPDHCPIDVVAEMQTIFFGNHPHETLVFQAFNFPTNNLDTFAQAQTMTTDFGAIKIAAPEFVLFYKAVFRRNENGKQDDLDIERLREMGLISDPMRVGSGLYALSGRNRFFTANLLQEIYG